MSIKLQKDDLAPNFELQANDNQTYTLDSFSDKVLILYFYPRDNTSGCTTEAVDFTRLKDEFDKLNAIIIGVSPDSIKSHCNFTEKHNLGILLLSDPEKNVAESYGAFGEKKMYGKVSKGIIRSTFIIKDGKILKSYYNVRAKGHAEKVLNDLKELI